MSNPQDKALEPDWQPARGRPVSIGDTFGRLTVIERVGEPGPRGGWGEMQILCRCACGNDKAFLPQNLTNGSTLSCGCQRSEVSSQLADANLRESMYTAKALLANDKLGHLLAERAAEVGSSVEVLTVLARPNDPYRAGIKALDADAIGEWFAGAWQQSLTAGGRNRTSIHLRGIHYAAVSLELTKPDGQPYRNDADDWGWLQHTAAKIARWLGYVPFVGVHDERNSAPVIRSARPLRPEAEAYIETPDGSVSPVAWARAAVDAGIETTITSWLRVPELDLMPRPTLLDFRGDAQPFRFVFFGEKASLEGELGPLAERYGADLYLPNGEASDAMIFQMAQAIVAEGRRGVIFYFSDCDPAGRQMPVSLSRKLQALKDLCLPDLECEVHAVALTPNQVREHNLPSAPMKESERRAQKWFEAFGTEQTEIDAIATLRPDLLVEMTEAAITPFIDGGLDARVRRVEAEWQSDATDLVGEALEAAGLDLDDGPEGLDELTEQASNVAEEFCVEARRRTTGVVIEAVARIETLKARFEEQTHDLVAEAQAQLDQLRASVEQLVQAQVDARDAAIETLALPPVPEIPEADVGATEPPLFDTDEDWVEQTKRLIDQKAY